MIENIIRTSYSLFDTSEVILELAVFWCKASSKKPYKAKVKQSHWNPSPSLNPNPNPNPNPYPNPNPNPNPS